MLHGVNMAEPKELLSDTQKPCGLDEAELEVICAEVHKAYCDERIRQGKEPYWTGGDYNKLDETAKDYDRVTVKAVLTCLSK